MPFDEKALERLLLQSDDQLWRTLTGIAAQNGVRMPDSPPSHDEMKKLRALLSGAERMNPADARKIMESLGKNNGR